MVLIRFDRHEDGTIGVDLAGPYYATDEQRQAIYAFLDRVAGPEAERRPVAIPWKEYTEPIGGEKRPWKPEDYLELLQGHAVGELVRRLNRGDMAVNMKLGAFVQPFRAWYEKGGRKGTPTLDDVVDYLGEM